MHGGTDSSHDKWPHYASLTKVSTQKQLPRAYILRDASTSKPQPAKMSGLAAQAELYTFSLIKNLSRLVLFSTFKCDRLISTTNERAAPVRSLTSDVGSKLQPGQAHSAAFGLPAFEQIP